MRAHTRASLDYKQFIESRKKYLGGSDISSVKNAGRYGCARKLGYDKLGFKKDVDDEDKMEFRRGHRLEGIAADYYEELTGRYTAITTTISVPGKPHLSVNVDRLVFKKEDAEKKNPGYLEIKVVSRHSWFKIKKEGLIDDYILQTQYGMAVAAFDWGSFAVYCPDLDALMHWDFEADRELGEHLLEAADDFWNFHVECGILPEPLPEDAKPCFGCPWEITCRGKVAPKENAGIVQRPDLEGLVAKFAELKGMGSEVEDAADSVRAEILEAVGEKPGLYVCGRFELPITSTSSKRFQSELLKKKNPALYEECRVETTTLTVKKPKEK